LKSNIVAGRRRQPEQDRARPWAGTDTRLGPGAPVGPANAIETRALTKRYGPRTVVDALTIRVPRGTICGLVGPNGAGKSTTMRMLLGLVAPSDGSATVLSEPITRPARYLRRVGALVEAPAFYPRLTARRNLEIIAALGGIPHGRIDEVLADIELSDRADTSVGSFSFGMKQRLGLAAALLGAKELLILDEPLNGLDPAGIQDMRAKIRQLRDHGMTIVVSSHLLGELEHVCDWLVVIRAGRNLFCGSLDEMLAKRDRGILVMADAAGQLAIVEQICCRAGYASRLEEDRLLVNAPSQWAGELNRLSMAGGATLTQLTCIRGDLEEAFLEITNSEPDRPSGEGGGP